jgi:hypothetical protein
MHLRLSLFSTFFLASAFCSGQEAEINAVLKVGPEAANQAEAARAIAMLSQAPAEQVPGILLAMNRANDLAANYLRSAVDTIVDRTLSAKAQLPLSEVRAFLLNTGNHPRARRLAYEILERVAPVEAAQLLPGFANDPSVELRYEAVRLLMQAADTQRDAKENKAALEGYQTALNAARDQKQIEKIAGELRTLGATVDLPRHFGFLTHWRVIGPFDNTHLAGFEAEYPPEKEMVETAEYEGKSGKVRWLEVATGDDYGKLDLNPPLGELKEVTGYAATRFESPIEGPAELRLGCKNGWKVWFNGAFLFGRDEYHRGARIDQYRLPVTLKKGANTLLLKLCQNADVKDWTREWEFQLRVCDATGTAILATDRPPTPASESKPKSKSKSPSKKK